MQGARILQITSSYDRPPGYTLSGSLPEIYPSAYHRDDLLILAVWHFCLYYDLLQMRYLDHKTFFLYCQLLLTK